MKVLKRLVLLLTVIILVGILVVFAQRQQFTRMNRTVVGRAEAAEKAGDLEAAARLYREHLAVESTDQEAKEKLADVLVSGGKNPARQDEATKLYSEILTREPGKIGVRRKRADLLFERGAFREAKEDFQSLVDVEDATKKDGALWFRLGRCREESKDDGKAAEAYQTAIDHLPDGDQRFEAYRRLAVLQFKPLKKPEDATKTIAALKAKDNARAYLQSGIYYQQVGDLEQARADLQHVLKENPETLDVYLELANLDIKNPEEARKTIKRGLEVESLRKEPRLYEALARVEMSTGGLDRAIGILRDAIAVIPDQPSLRFLLASALADRGETARLSAEIDELKRLGYANVLVELLEARNSINRKEWARARQTLTRIQPVFEPYPDYYTLIQKLLIRCYGELGDPERQRDAEALVLKTMPETPQKKQAEAESMARQGRLDEAIERYRTLVADYPAVKLRLAQLLTARGRQKPAGAKADWQEVGTLIQELSEKDPSSVEPALLKVDLLVAEGKADEARSAINEAIKKSPTSLALWSKSAAVFSGQRRFVEAKEQLDEADRIARREVDSLADQVKKATGDEAAGLRTKLDLAIRNLAAVLLEEGRLLIIHRPGGVADSLRQLAKRAEGWPRAVKLPLLETLAAESVILNNTSLSRDLWTQVASLDDKKLSPQLRLIDLMFLSRDRESGPREIEPQIKKIQALEGVDGQISRFQECRYLLWQANLKDEKGKSVLGDAERIRLRGAARNLLDELGTRRPDWSLVPLALGELADQELSDLEREQKDGNQVDPAINLKRAEAAGHYLKAVQLGNRDVAVGRAYKLFQDLKDTEGYDRLLNLLPGTAAIKNALARESADLALRQGNEAKALEIEAQALKDNPSDLQTRIRVAYLQAGQKRVQEAEETLRAGDPGGADPKIQLALVRLLCQTGQLDKAEQVERTAENPAKDRLNLGFLCELIAQAHAATKGNDDPASKEWQEKAGGWFAKAADDPSADRRVRREYISFLLRSKQVEKAREALKGLMEGKGQSGGTEEAEWAKRSLALVLAATGGTESLKQSLELARSIEEARASGRATPDDFRALANVYEVQRSPEYHRRAVKLMEELVQGGKSRPDDRFALAAMYRDDGDWPKAQDQYRHLIEETQQVGDLETLQRRPVYMGQYLTDLIKQYEAHREQDVLSQANELLKRYQDQQPDGLAPILLEAQLLKVQNHPGEAAGLLEATANRETTSDTAVREIARHAESIGLPQTAQRLLQQLLTRRNNAENRLALARFLGRQGRHVEALQTFKPLWDNAARPDLLVTAALLVLFEKPGPVETDALKELDRWIEEARKRSPNSANLVAGLGSLREQQQKVDEAMGFYRKAVQLDRDNITALNNLAWLLTLHHDKSGEAIGLIDRAVNLQPRNAELLDTRGMVYLAAGKTEEAIADLVRATQTEASAGKYFHLAQAYLQANQKDKAGDALAKAQEKGLKETDLHPLESETYKKVLAELRGR